MDKTRSAPRICATLMAALASAACAARATPGGLLHPSPFPTVASPSSIAPEEGNPSGIGPADLLRTALGLKGVPYQWGGDDPARGFDCSGFVRYVLTQHRIAAPRTSLEQYRLGTPVNRGQLRAGDLVFFSTIAPGASHVGLAINSQEFVHAPAASGVVRTERLSAPYWQARFVGARRIL